MEAAKPPVLWLWAYGCSHGAMQVHVAYSKRHSMLLGRGWEAFTHAHSFEDGHVLCFKLAEDDMLSIKFYERSGVLSAAAKGAQAMPNVLTSSYSDKEDNSGSGALGMSGSRGVKSKYDSPSSD
ncbi:l-ascorbate oxidase-like protein [Hordeum vulgare]|nr:l-ascorbate oxidase-like protein [Hordeum vulgare]